MSVRRLVGDSYVLAVRLPNYIASKLQRTRATWMYRFRYWRLRAQGYHSANYAWRDYGRQSPDQLRRMMGEIVRRANLPHFDVIIEQGCGTRGRTTPGLRDFATEIWGTDLLPENEIQGNDRYIKIDVNRPDCLHEVADNSVDAVVIINYVGMHSHSTWKDYFSPHNARLAAYMEPINFPRVLKPRGYLICAEWEAEPELRWGKASFDEIDRRCEESYKPSPLPGYELIACGFSREGHAPFVVYRRT